MQPNPEVVVSSFAFKTGAPEANLVIDVRFLPDPRLLMEENPLLDGTHDAVEDFIRTRSCFDQFFEVLKSQIASLFSDLRNRGMNRVEFAFGCTGGQHRSVFVAERLADWLRSHLCTERVCVHHRELSPRSSTDLGQKYLREDDMSALPFCHSPSSSSSDCISPSSSSSCSSGPNSMTLTYHPDSNAIHVEEFAPMRNSMSSEDVHSMLGSGLDRVKALRERRKKIKV